MEVRQAKFFLAIAKHGTTGRAAEVLHLTQPALSQAIRAMEREFGVNLFLRSKDGMRLTPAGEAIIGVARRLVEDASHARFLLQESKEIQAGALSIGVMPALAGSPVSNWVARFLKLQSNISVEIIPYRGEESPSKFLARTTAEFIIAIEDPEILSSIDELSLEHLIEEPLVLAHSPHLFPETDKLRTFEELTHYPIISSPRGTFMRNLIDRAFDSCGLQPRIVVETQFAEQVTILVREGVGYTLLPAHAIENLYQTGISFSHLEKPLTRRIVALCSPRNLSYTGDRFVRYLRAIQKELRYSS